MPEPLPTREELEEILARAEKATPGPCRVSLAEGCAWVDDSHGGVCYGSHPDGRPRVEDAEFYAHSREDVPSLASALMECREVLGIWANELCAREGAGGCPEDDPCFSCQSRTILGEAPSE